MKRTPAQIEASRANGAKSKGPKTGEGRERSSRNAVKHGLAAHKIVVLEGESEDKWQEFLDGYKIKFQPRDPVEEHLVTEMAVNRWRLQRAWALETATIDVKSAQPRPFARDDDEEEEIIEVHARSYIYWRGQIESLGRMESRLTRNFDRAFRTLTQLRKQSPPAAKVPEIKVKADVARPQTTKLQNEPEITVNTHPPARIGPSLVPQFPRFVTDPRPGQNDNLSAAS